MTIEGLLPKATYDTEADNRDYALDRNFSETGVNFVAIDLETATNRRNSICEIGITVVEKGEIKESRSWYVQPPGNRYFGINVAIHGITPEDTKASPSMKTVWSEVQPWLDGKVVVAHNTAFDMYVLRDSFLENDISFPDFPYFCSCRLSRKVVDSYSYSLPYVCEAMGIPFGGHHRAMSDSDGCARVFLEIIRRSGACSFADLQSRYNFRCGRFSDRYFRPQLANEKPRSGVKYDVRNIVGNPDMVDEDNYFFGKQVCFTGTCKFDSRNNLLQLIADIGGIPTNSVTSKTDILVVGQQDYRVVGQDGMSSKQKKAIALRDKGHDIEIMSEAEFLSNISI